MAGKSRGIWAGLAIGAVALGGLGTAATVGASQGDAGNVVAERPAQPVRVTPVVLDGARQVASYTGTIRPRDEVALGFRLAGKIVSRGVEVGDRVMRGQVVAQLDDTDARLERELAAAEAGAAQVDQARAVAELDRVRVLHAGGHAAQSVLDRATSGAAEAASRAERAARALALAQNRLDYTRLVAEWDGVVTATPAEPGQVLGAGQAVLSVARAGAVDVVFALPEQERGRIAEAEASAELWGGEGRSYPLSLRDISPDVDPAGRTYRVRMSLAAPDAEASLGRTATVHLDLGAAEPAAAVPLAAVMDDGAGPMVWRLEGDRVERVPVTVVSVSDRVARIRGPIRDGERIVSLGAHKIDPARPVRVVETRDLPES